MFLTLLLLFFYAQHSFTIPRVIINDSLCANDERENSALIIPKDLDGFNAAITRIQDCFENDFLARRYTWDMVKKADQNVYPLNDYETRVLHGMEYNAKISAQNGVRKLSNIVSFIAVADCLCSFPNLIKPDQTVGPFHFWVALRPENARAFFDSIAKIDGNAHITIHCVPTKELIKTEGHLRNSVYITRPTEAELLHEKRNYYQRRLNESRYRILATQISCKDVYGDRQFLPRDISCRVNSFL